MLKKTLAMLARYQPGDYVPDDVACYDEAEVEAFGHLLARLVYAPSKLRRRLQELGASITRADFYSEIPAVTDLEASFARPSRLRLDHPFKDTAFLQDFLRDLTPFGADFDPPVTSRHPSEYGWDNSQFSYSDAMSYYCMIRRCRPETIVEIGCGGSTLIASLACERNGFGRIIAIEPFPAPFLRQIPRVELIEQRAQDIDGAFIDANLGDGDILFIDTTHTVKHDSDCLHIYLRILPHLTHNILVHAHDIRLPDTLPLQMMRDHHIYWTEQYLLYAYLIGNPRTRVLYGSAYHDRTNPELLAAFMHGRYRHGGASLWFSQSGPVDSPIGAIKP
jgi:hypothetical protein